VVVLPKLLIVFLKFLTHKLFKEIIVLNNIRRFVTKHYFPVFFTLDVVIYSTLFILIASTLS
jgi:serine phosphatase RsbU (regulator of sigma subunit)